MSAISLHYFAGFGGGPKMTFPGLASRSGVLHNHKLALAALPEGGLAAGCEPGRIVGNPVAEDLREAAGLAPPEVSIHWIRSGETDHYFLGNEGLAQGQQAIRRSAMAGQERAYDWVIASAEGHPYDIDLIQSHKALRHAARFVRPGGLVLLLAEGSNGAGSRSIETWLRIPELENLECRARDEYDLNAQTAISLRSLCRDYQVVWLSDPLRSLLESSGANAVSSREEIGEACRARVPVTDGMRGAVLPRASAVIPS
jgi:nickel-dependent lactate racemase